MGDQCTGRVTEFGSAAVVLVFVRMPAPRHPECPCWCKGFEVHPPSPSPLPSCFSAFDVSHVNDVADLFRPPSLRPCFPHLCPLALPLAASAWLRCTGCVRLILRAVQRAAVASYYAQRNKGCTFRLR